MGNGEIETFQFNLWSGVVSILECVSLVSLLSSVRKTTSCLSVTSKWYCGLMAFKEEEM